MIKYLKYEIRNIEPLRIADDSTSQSGQTITLRYIPGSTIRGYVISQLANINKKLFEDNKKELFSNKIKFLNAYLTIENEGGKHVLMPSPKGFYEDKRIEKGKKEIQNVVVAGDFSEGYKRAALGRYCYFENDDCIYYYNVDINSDMKIKINIDKSEKQNVFRNEYIQENHLFTGYIAIESENIELKDEIKKTLKDIVTIGNARSAGFGKCEVVSCDYVNSIPYEQYLPAENVNKECYMMLLSNTVMRNELGELCGIDVHELEKQMEVDNLDIKYCSTSTVDVKGYNRTWKTKIPSMLMFEQGSVFHLTFDGEFKYENILKIVNNGIGERKNEGFGRVVFLNHYGDIKYKCPGDCKKYSISEFKESDDDMATINIIAQSYYRRLIEKVAQVYIVTNSFAKGDASNSQLGNIEAIAVANKYNPKRAFELINAYMNHTEDKEDSSNVQKKRRSIKKAFSFIRKIINSDLIDIIDADRKIIREKIMNIDRNNILDDDAVDRIKLDFLINLIRFDNKEGGN